MEANFSPERYHEISNDLSLSRLCGKRHISNPGINRHSFPAGLSSLYGAFEYAIDAAWAAISLLKNFGEEKMKSEDAAK